MKVGYQTKRVKQTKQRIQMEIRRNAECCELGEEMRQAKTKIFSRNEQNYEV